MLIFEADHKLLCEIVFSDIAYHAGEDFREQILELLNKVNLEYKSYYKLCIEKDGFVVLQTTVHFSSFGAVNRALCDGVKALAALYPEINDQVQRIEESNELS